MNTINLEGGLSWTPSTPPPSAYGPVAWQKYYYTDA